MRIVLAPAQATENSYATGGTNEAEQCSRIAEAAARNLRFAGHEARVLYGSFAAKASESDAWGADAYIPCHTNAGGGHGPEVLIHPLAQGNVLVQSVYDALVANSPYAGRGIKVRTDLAEIMLPQALTIYVEAEFHDNPQDAQWIIDHAEDIGRAIAQGVVNHAGGSLPGGGAHGVATQPDPAPDAPPVSGNTYVVRPGDTLSGIAASAGVSLGELQGWNPELFDARHHGGDLIWSGEVVRLGSGSVETHTVVPGDTLSGIAARNGTTWQELARINNITTPDLIYPGQTIRLR